MNLTKKITIALATALIAIQFIQPKKNIAQIQPGSDFTASFNIPAEVRSILQASCYDCHSNNTRYPWYSRIQPAGWWMGMHIKNAKKELNFDEFASYSPKKQYHKFEEMNEAVSEKEMPLSSYTLIHRDAILSNEQAESFIGWTKEMRQQLEASYPENSLNDSEKEENQDH